MEARVTKFKGKYRVETTRLESWDYAEPGYCFITFFTLLRIP
jgi:hypothetical protein